MACNASAPLGTKAETHWRRRGRKLRSSPVSTMGSSSTNKIRLVMTLLQFLTVQRKLSRMNLSDSFNKDWCSSGEDRLSFRPSAIRAAKFNGSFRPSEEVSVYSFPDGETCLKYRYRAQDATTNPAVRVNPSISCFSQ